MKKEMSFRNLKRYWILISKQQQKKHLEKHWIRICCRSYLIMMEICGLQQAASEFILIENSKGAVGYISRAAIDAILNGEEIDLSDSRVCI